MGKARRNRVQVDFDILEKRMKVIGISKAGISKQLGYSKAWFNSAKINGGRLRTKDAKDICDMLGLKPEDVIVRNDAIAQTPTQNAAEAQQEALQAADQLRARDDLDDFLEKIQGETYKPAATGLEFFGSLLGGGIVNQSLLLLLAAPAAGKTTICQQLAEAVAERGRDVIYLNLEMSREQMLAKAISGKLTDEGKRYSADKILQGYRWNEDEAQEIRRAVEEYRRTNLLHIRYNPDNVGSDIDRIREYLTQCGEAAKKENKPAPAVVLDYLHLISSAAALDPKELIKQSVVALKEYAIKYNTFVIAISATGRESNKGGRITLESGRDSSNIEYTADYVLSLNYTDLDSGKVSPGDPESVSRLQLANPRKMILRVLKARLTAAGRSEELDFDAAGNRFYSKTNWQRSDGGTPFDTLTKAATKQKRY